MIRSPRDFYVEQELNINRRNRAKQNSVSTFLIYTQRPLSLPELSKSDRIILIELGSPEFPFEICTLSLHLAVFGVMKHNVRSSLVPCSEIRVTRRRIPVVTFHHDVIHGFLHHPEPGHNTAIVLRLTVCSTGSPVLSR